MRHLVLFFLPLGSLAAQVSEADEIRFARSAAPAEVSAGARILVLREGRYVEAVRGSSDVTCYVSRSQAESFEPECFDAEASTTILPIHRFEVEQRLAGRARAEIDAAVEAKIRSGEFRLPRRPAMVYMMSAAQVLYTPDGRRVGAWRPHLMIYFPNMGPKDIGLPASTALISFQGEGTPTSAIVIPVKDFVQPAAP